MTIVRTLLAVASVRQWCTYHLDVKNVFLNRDRQEEVYMEPSFDVSHDSGYVFKFKKALYGVRPEKFQFLEKW